MRADRPTAPWRPAKLGTYPIRAVMTKTATPRKVWRLRWRADGVEFVSQFDRAGDARAWLTELEIGHGRDWWFDPVAKRYREEPFDPPPAVPEPPPAPPPAASTDRGLTVFELTERYWGRKWPTLEPKAREELARYLNRTRRRLLTREPTPTYAKAVDAYIKQGSLIVRPDAPLDDAARIGLDWLHQHSSPVAALGPREIEAFLRTYTVDQRDPTRPVSPATQRRMIADIRPMWAWAVRSGLADDDPWPAVDPPPLRATNARRRRTSTLEPADGDLVLSPSEIRTLACLCSVVGPWDGRVVCFVLVMGFCGLRPGEALGLVISDLELPPVGTGWLTVRRSRRRADKRFVDADEDPDWGPLKAKDVGASRRAPIPRDLVVLLRHHLGLFCADAGSTDLVFQRRGKPFNLEVFGNDAWAPARALMFPQSRDLPAESPLQPKRSRLRRHDLRHSACSMWFSADVPVAVCQRWSGHTQLSVFLDVYQGLIPGQHEEGAARLDAHLLDAKPVRRTIAGAQKSGRTLEDLAEASGIDLTTLTALAAGKMTAVHTDDLDRLAESAASTPDDIHGTSL